MDVAFRDENVKGLLWEEVSKKLAALGYHQSAKKFCIDLSPPPTDLSPIAPFITITLNYLGCSVQLQVLKSTGGFSHLSWSDRKSEEQQQNNKRRKQKKKREVQGKKE
ncbi:hypothetical protein ACFX1Q_037954 [Malus domestica]